MTRAFVWPVAVVLGLAGTVAGTSLARSAQRDPVTVTFVGEVLDSATKSPVRYGQVRVRSTSFVVAVDSTGAYPVGAKLIPGNYVLEVVAIGFNQVSQPVVVRDSGEIRMPPFVLTKAPIQLAHVYMGGAMMCTITPRRRGRLPEGARVVSTRDSTGRKRVLVQLCTFLP